MRSSKRKHFNAVGHVSTSTRSGPTGTLPGNDSHLIFEVRDLPGVMMLSEEPHDLTPVTVSESKVGRQNRGYILSLLTVLAETTIPRSRHEISKDVKADENTGLESHRASARWRYRTVGSNNSIAVKIDSSRSESLPSKLAAATYERRTSDSEIVRMKRGKLNIRVSRRGKRPNPPQLW